MATPSIHPRPAQPAPLAAAISNAAPRQRNDACPGALRLHQADDGGLARIRVPGGVLQAAQAAALGEAAQRLGDGDLHLTSRGNLQLRGLAEDSGVRLAQLLDGAGLLPSPAHERVRNIVASPLSGLDGHGHLDIRDRLAELDRRLCGSEEASELSGRFLFAVDDGRGDVAALGADVTLVAVREGGTLLRVGADDDAGALHIADPADTQAAASEASAASAAAAAVTAAEVFLEAARQCGVRAWRVGELPITGGELAHRIAQRLGKTGQIQQILPSPPLPPLSAHGPAPGLIPAPTGPATALSVLAPLGRLTGHQWTLLARTAEQEGSGELRLTPWRGVVVPGLPPERAPAALAALDDAGLVTDPASPWRGVGACAGRPGCAKSLTDVRADAAAAATSGSVDGARALPVYWSGCERRCGHPRGDRVEVVAGTDGYGVTVVRGTGDVHPVPLSPHALHAPHSELAATVAAARDPRSTDDPHPTTTAHSR
ncbi:precorrin-3B synthase [Streptomyces oryzae]|nr:precorrin-3B synthase [Streptomyces oryzae]